MPFVSKHWTAMLGASIAIGVLPACTDPVAPTTTSAKNSAAETCLSIGAWNDLHGQLGPAQPVVDTGAIPAGGVIALADAISDLRNTGDAVALLDAGDLFTGPLETTISEGAPVIDAYNAIGVDAVAVGNHEFDFGPVGYDILVAPDGTGDEAGPAGPRGALTARMASAKFPFLAANIHLPNGTAPNWPHFAPSTRIKRGNFDIGIVGYTTRETPTTTTHANVADLDFATNAAASVAKEIRALRTSGAYPVVLLAHASLDGTLSQLLDDPSDIDGKTCRGELAGLVESLGRDRPDLIIGGHRHAWMLGRIDGIPVVSSDQRGVGFARIRYCRSNGTTTLRSIDRSAVLSSTPPRTALGQTVARAIEPWMNVVRVKGEKLVATLPRVCPAQSPDGTRAAEQIARAMLDQVAASGAVPPGTRLVAMTNSGAIRTSLGPGTVKYSDLFAAFPFETTIALCKTTSAGLSRLLENALTDPSARRKFPFALAGAHATMTRGRDGNVTLDRVVVDEANGAASETSPIWVALPDFVLEGGDAMVEGVTCGPTVHTPVRLRDLWSARLAREQGGCEGAPKNLSFRNP